MKSSNRLNDVANPVSPPGWWKLFGESRAMLDIPAGLLSLAKSAIAKPQVQDALPIIIFPGFASDDKYTLPLRHHLKNLGYYTEGWGLGLNLAGANLEHALEDISDGWNVELKEGYSPEMYAGEGGVPFLCDKAVKQVSQRSDELNSPVVLIGWSLGGYLVREVARELPDKVAQVITLGAPIIGGPKYTKAATYFKAKGIDLDWIERESIKRESIPIQQPITAIYSKSDGIVDWHSAIDKLSPRVEHIEVNAAHLGMGFNPKIWQHIVNALSEQI